MAFELGVEENFFSTPVGNQVKEEECHFRRQKSTLVSSRRECTAWATLLNKLTDTLEEYLDFPNIDFHQIEVSSLYEVEKAAMECRKYWGLGDGPITSMVRVVENAGAIVSSFGDISEKVDALSLHRGRPIILINPNKSSPRLRMDIGHEAAHIILHNGIETGDRETEGQADYFSSHFILPRQALVKGYISRSKTRIDWNSIVSMKIQWGISIRAIIFRLNQAEIISPSQYRTANIHLSKNGWTKSEEYDEEVPKEYPELLPTSISLLGRSYGDSFGGLLKELSISAKFLAKLTQTKEIIEPLMQEKNLPKNITSIHAYKHLKANQ
ncbi:ImmA/IrrE family metallo-endopeptidase [Stutzerimonas nitrititolerans]|uniref:ImmA/IrrE family metallo-endopeptidase n=1 Tax=Stutzerimonas nitrititolerans TaxID=2482751 RepID=UPI0028A98FC1|nr:ImmA/IrrE family metallo-endopeptidase [Stutzerimonas nitrititolerans]